MKKCLVVLLLLVLIVQPISHNSVAQGATVVTYDAPTGSARSYDFDVTAQGNSVDLYGDTNMWNNQVSFGYFDFSGTVDIEIDVKFSFSTYKILPESLGITGTQNGSVISFSLSEPTKITIVFDDNYHGKIIHLFANALETNVPSSSDPDVIYFGPGYYDLKDTSKERIDVGSGQTLYIAGGAVVNGRIYVKDANDVTIRGRGIVTMDWRETADKYIWDVAMFIDDSSDVSLSGIIVNRRTNNWSGKIVNSDNITINDYKVVSPTYTCSDGLNLINCNNITYDNCFFHDCDDNISIKGVVSDTGYEADDNPDNADGNYDITIQNSQFWSDANNSIVLGEESQAEFYENILYKDLDIMHVNDHAPDMGAISITCLNGTEFRNIRYENIRVGPCNKMILLNFTDYWYNGSLTGDQTHQGYMNDIRFKDITATGSGDNEIKILGWSDDKQISGLRFENIKINGNYVESLADSHFNMNQYVKTVDISYPGEPSDTYHMGLDFSTAQGTNNWSYKEWNGSSYSDLTWNASRNMWVGSYYYLNIWDPVFMHPHTNDAVRAWKAPESGNVLIKGLVQKWDISGGDGVKVKIMKNDTQIWPESGWMYLAYDNNIGHFHSINTTVSQDDMIYFIVNQKTNESYDATFWDAEISYTPTYNAATDFGTYQYALGWQYLEWDGSAYTDMTWDSVNNWWQGTNTYSKIWDGPYMHPHTNDTVRAWYSNQAGTINIAGVIKDMDSNGDGVRVKIMKNSTQIWPSSGWETISAGGSSVHDSNLSVNAGDRIYFHVNDNGDYAYDSVYWAPTITYE